MTVSGWLEPFQSTNTYGLFAVMTTSRPEIIVEGSDDGVGMDALPLSLEARRAGRAGRGSSLHLPRLDWQMWFAALAGNCQRVPWFFRFEQRLLEGSPAVLGLLADDPFLFQPPRYIRAHDCIYIDSRLGARRIGGLAKIADCSARR